jgi:hypothetical protein
MTDDSTADSMADPIARAVISSMPEVNQMEVLDVYSSIVILMAARDDIHHTSTAMTAMRQQFCEEHVAIGIAVAAGEFVKMLAEMLGQSVDEIVRNTLKSRHGDPTDLEMFDIIVKFADTGEMPEGIEPLGEEPPS